MPLRLMPSWFVGPAVCLRSMSDPPPHDAARLPSTHRSHCRASRGLGMLRARRTSWREPMPGAAKKEPPGKKSRRLWKSDRSSDQLLGRSPPSIVQTEVGYRLLPLPARLHLHHELRDTPSWVVSHGKPGPRLARRAVALSGSSPISCRRCQRQQSFRFRIEHVPKTRATSEFRDVHLELPSLVAPFLMVRSAVDAYVMIGVTSAYRIHSHRVVPPSSDSRPSASACLRRLPRPAP